MEKLKSDILFLDENTLEDMIRVGDAMTGGFFVYHADGNEELIYCNNGVLRIFGCETMDEFKKLTGWSFKGIVHPEDYRRVEASIERQISLSTFNLDYVEYRIIRKDGSVGFVADYGHFMHTKTYGDVFYVFLDDASEQLQKRVYELEEIVEELNFAYGRDKQFKNAILHDAVSFFEINLTKNRLITTTVSTNFGKQRQDLFELMDVRPITEYSECMEYLEKVTHIDDKQKHREFFDRERLIKRFEEGEVETSCDFKMVDLSGEERIFRDIFLLGKNDETDDVIALFIAKDVTEAVESRKRLEHAMRKADEASAAKHAFLYSMSHDIKTPMNAVMGYIDIIESNADDPEKVRETLAKMKRSGKQLVDIITESAEIAHMESGELRLMENNCSLKMLINDAIAGVAALAASKKTVILADMTKTHNVDVIADTIRLKEIIYQLLDNAVKYSENGGKVMISVLENVTNKPRSSEYKFVISDDGPGIPPEFMEKMFRPFERRSDTTASGVHGTGLGLTVAKDLAELMGGSIEAQSELGRGSTFTVTVEFTHAEKHQDGFAEEALQKVDISGKKLLIVDDNEINMEIATEILSELGFVVDTASNGKAAVEKVSRSAKGTYDVILMDLQMPVMNGYDAARAIRALEDPELANIPIIAVSANTFADDCEKSLDAGMNAHFPKPIDFNSLCDLIGRVLAKAG